MKLGLENKRALVLGASRGLGAAVAIALANEGATVIGASRSPDDIEKLNARLEAGATGAISAITADLEKPDSIHALADALLAQNGVDIIINNSGGPPPGEARNTAPETFARQFEVMVGNLIELNQKLLPGMVTKGWGRIVTLTSSGVVVPIPRLAISNALRQAIVGWSKTLAAEVANEGITVNVIIQGRIHTDRVDQLDEGAAKRLGKSIEDVRAASRATIPMGRYGRPEELAEVVAFLVSERASYVTGSQIRVDGGMIKAV